MSAPPLDEPAARTMPALSPREIEVLRVWLRHGSKEEAARSMYIAPTTLNTHITRIRDKYATVGRNASSKARLLICALQDGLVHLDEFDDLDGPDRGLVLIA